MAERTTDYVVLGWDEDADELTAVTEHRPVLGSTTEPLDSAIFVPCDLAVAKVIQREIITLDKHFWPNVNPFVARLDQGKVVAITDANLSVNGKAKAQELARQNGLQYESA